MNESKLKVSKKIIQKIKNLLALSKNNSNQNEAYNSMLLAQKLMMKYKIEISELELEDKEGIVEQIYNTKKGIWRKLLIKEISVNFNCDVYLRGNVIIIMGTPEDIEITKIMYEYSEEQVILQFKALLKDEYDLGSSDIKYRNMLFRSYAYGFITGLDLKFKEQKQKYQDEWGLVLVNKDLEDYRESKQIKKTRTYNTSDIDRYASRKGQNDGYNMSNPNVIENKSEVH